MFSITLGSTCRKTSCQEDRCQVMCCLLAQIYTCVCLVFIKPHLLTNLSHKLSLLYGSSGIFSLLIVTRANMRIENLEEKDEWHSDILSDFSIHCHCWPQIRNKPNDYLSLLAFYHKLSLRTSDSGLYSPGIQGRIVGSGVEFSCLTWYIKSCLINGIKFEVQKPPKFCLYTFIMLHI